MPRTAIVVGSYAQKRHEQESEPWVELAIENSDSAAAEEKRDLFSPPGGGSRALR